MLLSKSVCHDKFVKCRDIYATPMSSAFIASLSQQCGLTFFFDDCRDKLFIVVTNFLCLLLCLCCDKVVKCLDKVQLTLFHNCRYKLFYAVTFFQCFLINSSNSLPRHIFECRDNVLLSFALFFVMTKCEMS